MGPAATVDFLDKLVKATPADTDQDHVRTVTWSDPTVPNRHAAILGDGEDPRPALRHGVETLMAAGAEILVVPCNTVHAFMDDVVSGIEVEFISIIDVTVAAVREQIAPPEASRVGLIAADGAVASGRYQHALSEAGLEPLLLSDAAQAELMKCIYSIKAGQPAEQLAGDIAGLFSELVDGGAGAIIAGCTEISIVVDQLNLNVPVIDPSKVLAAAAVERAWARP